MTLADQEARRRIAEDVGTTFLVEAAAGTGKTTSLIGRILALIRSGRGRLSQIVAVTFTDKAAGEMKLRLREALEQSRGEASEAIRERLDQALRELEVARISTIHAFCADLLRERPVEAQIDPRFTVTSEGEGQDIFDRVFDGWFQGVLADPPEGIRRTLRRRDKRGDGPRERLRTAAWQLAQERDLDAPWGLRDVDREMLIGDFVTSMRGCGALAELALSPDDWLAKNLIAIHHWCQELDHRESVRPRDWDGLEGELHALSRDLHWHHRGFGKFRDMDRADVIRQRDALKAQLDHTLNELDRNLAPLLHRALWEVVRLYEEAKNRAGVLDFFDLIHRARNLLVGNQEIRNHYQTAFTHVLVDEFQDTDPLQAEILLLLCAEAPEAVDGLTAKPVDGKLFIVGDPKQSIYRFRRADVSLYESLKGRLQSHGAEVLHLSTSFRSDRRIQAVVNATFEPLMQGNGQAHYVPLEAHRPADETRPAVVVLPSSHPYDSYGRIMDWAVKKAAPEETAAFIAWMVKDSGWTVSEPGTGNVVPIAPRHICLLFRRMQSFGGDVSEGYVRALEGLGIPHVLVGGRGFHEREEIAALRQVITAIEWPDDELAVFASLRGPLFALGDDALLAFRSEVGPLHPLRSPPSTDLSPGLLEVRAVLEILGGLHRRRNRQPFPSTLTELLESARAHAGLAFWVGGEQVLASVLRLIEMARAFEGRTAHSFRGFAERLLRDAELGRGDEGGLYEEGADGVRIMTVHRAKGLEFPVVVLADPTCRAVSERPSRFIDLAQHGGYFPLAGCVPAELDLHRDEVMLRDREESDRLLYVAMTRARDILVLPGVGDDAPGGGISDRWWIGPAGGAIFPPDAGRREGMGAPGCPPFGDASVVHRPGKARVVRDPLRPGRYVMGPDQEVVWWDPHHLKREGAGPSGLRYEKILVPDSGGVVAEASLLQHATWQAARAHAQAQGGVPSRTVRTPTEGLTGSPQPGSGVVVEATDLADRPRPGGARFGTLVHQVLAAAHPGRPDDIPALVAWHGRLVGATPGEGDAAAAAVLAALQHPRFIQAFASPDLRREVALASVEEDGTVLEGTADLVYRDGEGSDAQWVVVDYKTGLAGADEIIKWKDQVTAYTRAIARVTGLPTTGCILRV